MLCENILDTHHVKADINADVLYIYSEEVGYYRRWNRRHFLLWLQTAFGSSEYFPYLNIGITHETFERLVATPSIQISLDDFDKDKRYLNVLNGVVDLENGHLLPHDKEYHFSYVLFSRYDESYAKSEKIPQPFNAILDRHFPDPDDQSMFLESLAYLISGEYGMKTAYMWIGEPHTGKSTVMRLLKTFLGDWATHHSLKQISSKHGLADLEFSKVNICAEVEKDRIANMDNFKSLVGNDYLSIEPKIHALRTMKARTKLLLIGNDFPPFAKGLGEPAIFDRLLPIRWLNPYSKDERISLYDDELMEKHGWEIFSVIVRELCKLYAKSYQFTHSRLSHMEIRRFRYQNMLPDSISSFLEDCCIAREGFFWKCSDIYEKYLDHCAANAYEPIAKGSFFREFSSKANAVPTKRLDKKSEKQCRGYMGIAPA